MWFVAQSRIYTLYRRAKGRIRRELQLTPRTAPPPHRFAGLPLGGECTSVERALNSRCSSDYDGDPDVFHWGMFDTTAQLSAAQISRIAELAKHCRFSSSGTEVEVDGDRLTFLVKKATDPDLLELQMVESGMQQQAVALLCSALGVGMTFMAVGLDGREISPQKFAAIQIRIGPMKSAYGPDFWTCSAPTRELPWVPGNLPNPRRDGTVPLVDVLQGVSFDKREGTAVNRHGLGQLLWAARGRTPHLYKSRPWGLTIPTWAGFQDISAVYVAQGTTFSKYVNWHKGRPTHTLHTILTDSALLNRLGSAISPWTCLVLLATNDPCARGLWEVGYELLNILVQASTLGIGYEVIALGNGRRAMLNDIPIERPIAAVALRAGDELPS